MPTLSADGDTAECLVKGTVRIHGSGPFGGGTLTFRFLGTDGAYHDIADAAFTAAFDKILELPKQTTIKGTLSGSTSPTLYYEIHP